MSLRAREDRPGLAVSICLFVFVCFAGIDICAKWLIEAGLPVMEIVFVRYLGHLILVIGLFGPAQGGALWRMNRPALTLARGSMLMCATASNFIALQYLPLTITTSIFYASPLVVTLLAMLFLGERIGPRRMAAVIVGLAGVLIITRPWGESFQWAMLISCIPPVAAAVYGVLTRKLAGEEAPDTMQFWAAAIPVVCLLPLALADWRWPSAPIEWILFFCIGFFGWLGHQLFVLAHRYADASTLAPITYVHIVYMTAASWLIFHHPPGFWTILGASIIVAAGLYVWLREQAIARRDAA